jgi:hypothetical protein
MIPGFVSTPIPFVLSSLTKIKDDRGDTSTGLTAKLRNNAIYSMVYIQYTVPWYTPTVLPFIFGSHSQYRKNRQCKYQSIGIGTVVVVHRTTYLLHSVWLCFALTGLTNNTV